MSRIVHLNTLVIDWISPKRTVRNTAAMTLYLVHNWPRRNDHATDATGSTHRRLCLNSRHGEGGLARSEGGSRCEEVRLSSHRRLEEEPERLGGLFDKSIAEEF